jgi:RHS repeat-associated protein
VHGPGSDEPLVWYEGSGTSDKRWMMADERGSVVAVSNSAGAVTQVNKYDPDGVPDAGNAGRFQYTGQLWIAEAGIYHFKARAYHPGLGRFLQTDPSGFAGGMNLYAYAGGDPVNFTDPTGLDCVRNYMAAFGKVPFMAGCDTPSQDPPCAAPGDDVTVCGHTSPPPDIAPFVPSWLPNVTVGDPPPTQAPPGGAPPRSAGQSVVQCPGGGTPSRANNPNVQSNVTHSASTGALLGAGIGALIAFNIGGFPEVEIFEGVVATAGGGAFTMSLFTAAAAEPAGSMVVGAVTAAAYTAPLGGAVGFGLTQPTCPRP